MPMIFTNKENAFLRMRCCQDTFMSVCLCQATRICLTEKYIRNSYRRLIHLRNLQNTQKHNQSFRQHKVQILSFARTEFFGCATHYFRKKRCRQPVKSTVFHDFLEHPLLCRAFAEYADSVKSSTRWIK